MRWSSSLVVLSFFFSSLICESVLAAPVPPEVHLLFRRGGGKITSKDVKKSSGTYRNAAAQHPYAYVDDGHGGVKTVAVPNTVQKGKDADHILEAQTVADAISTHHGAIPPHVVDGVKDRLNGPPNLVWVDPSINRSKGQVNKAVIHGNTPTVKPEVQDYMKKTGKQGMNAAKDIDKYLTSEGYPGNHVQKAEKEVLKQAKALRR